MRRCLKKKEGREKRHSPLQPPIEKREERKKYLPIPIPIPLPNPPSPKPSPLPSGMEKGKGEVDLHQKRSGEGKAVRVDAELILHSPLDPVQVALNVLRIPPVAADAGVRYNNARIMRHLLRIIGEAAFRDATYRQWRENAIDGEPRSRARAFMAKRGHDQVHPLCDGGVHA